MHVNFEQVPQNIWNYQEFTFHFVDLKFSYISYLSLLAGQHIIIGCVQKVYPSFIKHSYIWINEFVDVYKFNVVYV